MLLFASTTSPFVRMVRVAAIELGLDSNIELRQNALLDPNSNLEKISPIKKIPLLQHGELIIPETLSIIEYLQEQAQDYRLLPQQGPTKYQLRYLYYQIVGVLDAGVLYFYGTNIPKSEQPTSLLTKYLARIKRTLNHLETTSAFANTELNIATLALTACFGFYDFRLSDLAIPRDYPKLQSVAQAIGELPALQQTKPFTPK